MNKGNRYYLLIGDREAWNTALLHKTWGFNERTKALWNSVNPGEIVAFYVTAPTKKIIGFGIIERKFIHNNIFWPDEKLLNKIIWKYRLGFTLLHVIDNWEMGINPPKNLFLRTGRKVIPENQFLKILKTADNKWKTSMSEEIHFRF